MKSNYLSIRFSIPTDSPVICQDVFSYAKNLVTFNLFRFLFIKYLVLDPFQLFLIVKHLVNFKSFEFYFGIVVLTV